jgi:hypothetical protein
MSKSYYELMYLVNTYNTATLWRIQNELRGFVPKFLPLYPRNRVLAF